MHHKGTIRSSFGTRFGPDPDSSALFVAHAEIRDLSSVPRATTKSQGKMAMRLTAPELPVPSTPKQHLSLQHFSTRWKAKTFPEGMHLSL